MKKLFVFFVLLTFSSFFSPYSANAASFVPPQPPFSVEGNPEGEDLFGAMFTLLTYIRAPALEIYENRERTRNYENLWVCDDGDRRDYYCDNEGDGCDGGDVDLCEFGTDSVARTATSGPTSCKLGKPKPEDPYGLIVGKCDYSQIPRIFSDIKGADFSNADQTVFDKIQSKSGAYNNVGTDNAITWGSQHLSSTFEQKIINQLLVVRRAKQTKATLHETGEWPLGWVDWGYKTPNGKTLLAINDELPDSIASVANNIVEGVDDFYLNAGNLEAITDISSDKQVVIDEVNKALKESPPPEWLVDLMQAPMYSPSWRQSYVRPSICVWKICRPGTRGGWVPQPPGIKRALYYDNSISQAFGAALDAMLTQYPLEEGIAVFKQLVIKNPLIRFATSASVNAIPSKIMERLNKEIVKDDSCLKYHAGMRFLVFGQFMDYVKPGDFFDAARKCPVYQIYPELSKQNAAAFYQSPIQALIAMIWGQRQDEVDSVVYHLITIPEAMGQSIQEIQQPVYDTRDTLAELELVKDYNINLSNTVDDNANYLYAGETPFTPLRNLGLYPCADNMFSSQLKTSIFDYAGGKRVGCFDTTTVPEGKCDGKLFGELLKTGNYQESGTKGSDYFNNSIKGMLTPELMNTYAAAEKETGVPCEILAGIHFVEADNNPDGSLVSGRKIGTPEPDAGGKVFHSLLETAVYAGGHLKGKVGGNLKDVNTTITALSRYNGGGNSNCQLGYPYPIPYGGCPRLFEGEDDPYPVSFLDPKHDQMYLLYCADYTACAPAIFERPGSFTVALNVYNSITKGGYNNSELPSPTPKPSTSPTPPSGPKAPGGFFPRSCGPQSLSTALGCIPYTRDAFASALLSFIVGIAGAIALVIMLIATFQIMTAGGNPEQLKKGRELFTSAIIGLLFLIFSVSLLRIVAGDIIKLPGFTR